MLKKVQTRLGVFIVFLSFVFYFFEHHGSELGFYGGGLPILLAVSFVFLVVLIGKVALPIANWLASKKKPIVARCIKIGAIGGILSLGLIVGWSFIAIYQDIINLTEQNSLSLLLALIALLVSLAGFITTTVFAWRADQRAEKAELRAQEEFRIRAEKNKDT